MRLERMLKRPVAKAFMDKYRSEGHVVGDIFAGDVKDSIAIIIDDLIAGGGTVACTAAACRANGAAHVWVAANPTASFPKRRRPRLRARRLTGSSSPIQRRCNRPWWPRLAIDCFIVVSVTGLLAEAIRRLHANGSITQLLENGP